MKVNIGRYLSTKERKINIEIENFDTWSLDHTLSLIIWPALIQLKHTKNGIPSDFVNDSAEDYCAQTSFDFMKEDKNEVFQKGCDAWETVLDKMIWSFQEIALGDYDSQYHHGNIRASWKKTGRHYEMVDENPDEHWYDQAGHRLHEKRIQEGLDLFAKYFRNLWD
jgi:hypothetical protein